MTPWGLKTAEQWRQQEKSFHNGKSKAAWFILVAAAYDNVLDVHDRAFLQKWELEIAHDVFFANDSSFLDKEVQKRKLSEESNRQYWQRHPNAFENHQAELEQFIHLFAHPNFLPFILAMRSIRDEQKLRVKVNEDLVQNKQKRGDPPLRFVEEAAKRMQLTPNALEMLQENYVELVNLLTEHFKLESRRNRQRTFESDSTTDDIKQENYLEVVDTIVAFPFWETVLFHPEMTLERLFLYTARSLAGYQKGTDATRVQVRQGKTEDGEEVSLDVYRAKGLDPAEATVSDAGYRELRQLIVEETERLGLDSRTPEMLEALKEGYSVKNIAERYGLKPEAVGSMLLQLRHAVGARIDPEREIQNRRDLNHVWEELLDKASLQRMQKDMQSFPLRPFHKRILEFAIEKAQELLADTTGDTSDVLTARKIIVKHVATRLQQEYADVSRDPQVAASTALRHIKKAWNLIHGVEEYDDEGRKRQGVAIRSKETRDWKNFVIANPQWKGYFTPKEQTIISLYYLNGNGNQLTQSEIATIMGIDNSGVSRRLETIAQKRIRLGSLQKRRQAQ